jgi:hypothetical protein
VPQIQFRTLPKLALTSEMMRRAHAARACSVGTLRFAHPTLCCATSLVNALAHGFTIHEALRLCYGSDDSGRELSHSTERRATHMLPNFKIVIGGVLIFVLLFAVTGAGVVTPQIYTRVGAMPEIGRPMMQRVIGDEPALAQLPSSTRRGDELRLRELATLAAVLEPPAAPSQDEPAVNERTVEERSEMAVEVATIEAALASAASPPSGPRLIAQPSRAANAIGEPVATTALTAPAAPEEAARPIAAALTTEAVTDADRTEPPADGPPQARPAARPGAASADLTKPSGGNHSTNAGVPKRSHRAAALTRKHAAHRVRQPAPAPTPNPAFNLFGQSSFQSHF